jgi:membrane-associated phospholipid phosphatase
VKAVTSGAVRRRSATPVAAAEPAATVDHPVGVGRPPWWLMVASLALTAVVTADLLARGRLERMDLRVSEMVSSWGLKDSPVTYWPVWCVTQFGGRGFILLVLAGLVGFLTWRRRSLLPLARVLVALALLTGVVYGFKYGMGRTAPSYPGSFFHRDGASFPSGHVANAVLMWGVARWQAVDFGLPLGVQRLFRLLSVGGPVLAAVAMVSLDFHWVTDAAVGAAVGLLLLGVVHALDALILSRWVRVFGRRSA